MNKKIKTLAVLVASLSMVTGLASCSNNNEELELAKAQLEAAQAQIAAAKKETADANAALGDANAQIEELNKNIANLEAEIEELESQLEPVEYDEADLEIVKIQGVNSIKEVFEALDGVSFDTNTQKQFDTILKYAEESIESATNVNTVYGIVSTLRGYVNAVVGAEKGANGAYSFVAATYQERTKILAILEKYAVEHFLTGFSFIDDGGYALYRPEVQFGTDSYITGYGWGIAGEGAITADLPNESNEAWKRYYHTYETADPATINYGDDKGAVVGDLVDQVAASYWGARMNETKDGYEYYPMLAKEMPVAVDESSKTHLASTWKWEIKTEADGAKYSTLSSDPAIAAYNGRGIKAEDYLTPFKMLWTQANGWARATDNHGSSAEVVGEADYYAASKEGFNETAFAKTGVKVFEEDGKWYFQVQYKQPCNAFYARYYINSSIYAPVPEEFVTTTLGGGDFLAGSALFGNVNLDKKYTPVDTYLSTGPFTIEQWDADSQIVFKKSENYTEEGRFNIAGYHYDILAAANTDTEAALKEFLAGNLHSCGIPSTQLKTYQYYNNTDPENGPVGVAYQVPGSGNYKLNVNSCTQDMWEYLFGVDGTITQTSIEEYWICEPAMSNKNFLLGLSYALNRQEFAATLGRGPSVNYFGDAYMSDPENGIAYNTTEEHKEAIADLIAVGDGYGYDLETAKAYFEAALKEMIAEGLYEKGDTIEIEIAWQTQSQFQNYGDPIIGYWQDAFKDVGDKYGITLKVVNWAGAVWSDVYYKKMMLGQFDVGFGSISGNALNPINFLEVLKSDNSSGFTLNWGSDTSALNLEYNGQLWSFDGLWKAADQGGYFENGVAAPLYNTADEMSASIEVTKNADGTATLKVYVGQKVGVDGVEVTVSKALVNGYTTGGVYEEYECDFVLGDDGYLVITVNPVTLSRFTENNYYAAYDNLTYLDVTFKNYILDVPGEETLLLKFYFG